MGQPFLFVENMFSRIQFPGHTVSATEEPTDQEAHRAANGRRSSLDYAGPTTTNTEWSLKSAFNRLRCINTWALDRGHNLLGKRIIGEISSDDFATVETAFDITLPTASTPGRLDNPLGAVTEESAWLIRHEPRAGHACRLRIPAMGAGLAPRVVGAFAGRGWSVPGFSLPLGAGVHQLRGEALENDLGWLARGRSAQLREGTVRLKLDDVFKHEIGRYHLEGHYGAGRPMWLVLDDGQADEAFQVIRPDGPLGFVRDLRNFQPAIDVGYREHEPRAAA